MTIRLIEELSLNAWPAVHTLSYDGWLLRFSGGYTRRANCVNPLYPARLALSDKIALCEQAYRQQNLPVIFKISADPDLQALDRALEANGYRQEALTSVQQLELRDQDSAPPAGVQVSASATTEWLAAFSRMSSLEGDRRTRHEDILARILPEQAFVSVRRDGETVGCGLGVLQGGYVGAYDVIVDARYRRQGIGEAVMRGILAWSKARGAQQAYLQVMQNNPAALRLYARLGYREVYPYWYRVKA